MSNVLAHTEKAMNRGRHGIFGLDPDVGKCNKICLKAMSLPSLLGSSSPTPDSSVTKVHVASRMNTDFDQQVNSVSSSIRNIVVGFSSSSQAPSGTLARGSRRSFTDSNNLMAEKIRLFKYSRKSEEVRREGSLSRIEVTVPEVRHDIIERNIIALPSMTHSKILSYKSESFKERDRRLAEAKSRHKKYLCAFEKKLVTDLFLRFSSGLHISGLEKFLDLHFDSIHGITDWLTIGMSGHVLLELLSSVLNSKRDLSSSSRVVFSQFLPAPGLSSACQCIDTSAVETLNLIRDSFDSKVKLIFIQSFIKGKFQLRKLRMSARFIWDYLKSWRRAGAVLVSMKKFTFSIIKLQTYWRKCSVKIKQQVDIVSQRWFTIERQILAKEIGGAAAAATLMEQQQQQQLVSCLKGPVKRQLGVLGQAGLSVLIGGVQVGSLAAHALGLSEKVTLAMISEKTRKEFIRFELRFLRYSWLFKYKVWVASMQEYWQQVSDWRNEDSIQKSIIAAANNRSGISNESSDIMGMRAAGGRRSSPPLRPPCPTYMPSDEDITAMYQRCRKDRKSFRVCEASPLFQVLPGTSSTNRKPSVKNTVDLSTDSKKFQGKQLLSVDDEEFTTLTLNP